MAWRNAKRHDTISPLFAFVLRDDVTSCGVSLAFCAVVCVAGCVVCDAKASPDVIDTTDFDYRP